MTAAPTRAEDRHRITGRAWVLGNSVNTDALYPGFAMRMPTAEAALYVLYDQRPGWAESVTCHPMPSSNHIPDNRAGEGHHD